MLKNIHHISFFLILFGILPISANETKEPSAENVDKKSEIKDYILHHLQDSHDFNLLSYTNNEGKKIHIGFPLPVILWDKGLKTFSSSKLHHGESVAHVGENYYKLEHNKIYKTNSEGLIKYDEFHHPTNTSIQPL